MGLFWVLKALFMEKGNVPASTWMDGICLNILAFPLEFLLQIIALKRFIINLTIPFIN